MAKGRTGKKAKAAARREQRKQRNKGGLVTEAMEESEAAKLAAEHLAELDRQGIVEVRRPVAQTRKLAKPEDAVLPGAVFVGKGHPLAPPGSTALTAESFRDYVKTLQVEAATDPAMARLLLELDRAPQLVCDCGLGRYCHARPIMHFGHQLRGLASLAEGMRLLDCCWWMCE